MLKQMMLAAAVLVAVSACNKDNERGTCTRTLVAGPDLLPRCTVNEVRYQCRDSKGIYLDSHFEVEDKTAGLARCKSGGYEKVDYIARSCEKGGTDLRMDTGPGGAIPDDMIDLAFKNNCGVSFEKPPIKAP